MREELVENGKVVGNIFIVDTPFSSPSAAAAAILGGESNGQTLWRNKDGKTLKELNSKQLSWFISEAQSGWRDDLTATPDSRRTWGYLESLI